MAALTNEDLMTPFPRVIICHTPKSGGTALRQAIARALGSDAIRDDYGDRIWNPQSRFNIDPVGFWESTAHLDIDRIVFGHFHIHKYRNVRDAPRITLLRHPLDWMISLYFFVLAEAGKGSQHPIIRYVADNGITIEQFSRLPNVQRFFTHLMFRDVEMSLFDLIILHDRMDSGVAALQKILSAPLALLEENATEEVFPAYRSRRAEVRADARLMSALTDNLRDQIEFFERCAVLPSVV